MKNNKHKTKERFLNKISKAKDGCWNWTGNLLKSGYGR